MPESVVFFLLAIGLHVAGTMFAFFLLYRGSTNDAKTPAFWIIWLTALAGAQFLNEVATRRTVTENASDLSRQMGYISLQLDIRGNVK